MWRSPQRATDIFAAGVARHYAQHPDLARIRFQPLPTKNPAFRLLCHWVNRINEEYWATDNRDMRSFRRWYRRFMVAEVLDMERSGGYGLITDMTLFIHQADKHLASKFDDFTPMIKELWSVLLTQILLLLGTETRVLVGTRRGVPAWRDVPRIQDEEIPHCMLGTCMAAYAAMHHVGREDAWMVPSFREFDLEAYGAYEREVTYLEITRSFIESAFYRQRYLVDPEGVYVKVTNARNVTGLYLKVHAREGSELVDILVRAETTEGAVFFVLTETALVEASLDTTYFCPGSYLACLAAQVYHDLVTATTVSGTRTIRDGSGAGAPPPPRGDEPTWTVIPRKVRNVVREPRTEIQQRSVTEPHRVTGHLRKASMTDKHRDALLHFERETGLQVLRFVPEGYTFVRPHISPRASAEGLAALPRFIRYRIQQALEAKMKARELRD